MSLASRTSVAVLAATLLVGACSSSPPAEGTTSPSIPASEAPASEAPASAPSVSASAPAASAAVAGEPCSFLTAEEVGAIVGTTPVEVAERAGRGDCDYWLSAAKDEKVNVGVITGAEAATYFETTKGVGTPEPVSGLGDEAYSVFNEGFGTVVVARKGDTVVAVQVFAGAAADQLRQSTALVEAVMSGL